MITDEALVQRVKEGDRRAFDLLMQRHQGFVRRALCRFRCFQPSELDDACQEVFIKAYLALTQFRAESRFTTWIYRISTNFALERLRGRDISFSELDEQLHRFPEDNTQRIDLRRDISIAFNKITAQQKQVIYLCLMEGLTHAEVAEQISMPLGTVKTHALRGRSQLQGMLSDWRESSFGIANMERTEFAGGSHCAVE